MSAAVVFVSLGRHRALTSGHPTSTVGARDGIDQIDLTMSFGVCVVAGFWIPRSWRTQIARRTQTRRCGMHPLRAAAHKR